ncbi:MAG: hypothetical protein GKR97_16140 [Rhizobiaceae bacterium]|nr:hypothetical protein [Rhizobiaceae bacterium]
MRLNDPSADGGDTLAGETIELPSGATNSGVKKIGPATPVATNRSGRVDNFAWPPKETSSVVPIAIAAPKPETPINLQ